MLNRWNFLKTGFYEGIKVDEETTPNRLGPRLGEHTDQVLREYAGASDAEIEAWRRDGVL